MAILFIASGLISRNSGEQFDFLKGHPLSLKTNPGSDYIGRVYSFPGNVDEVNTAARTELVVKGFTVHEDPRSSDVMYTKAETRTSVNVWITTGKARGKSWVIDGDMLDVDHAAKDWVTVEVTEPDRVAWLRHLISF